MVENIVGKWEMRGVKSRDFVGKCWSVKKYLQINQVIDYSVIDFSALNHNFVFILASSSGSYSVVM